MTIGTFAILRASVKAIMAMGLVASTCAAIIIFPERVSAEGLGLLGTLTGVVLTHYFQQDSGEMKYITSELSKTFDHARGERK